MTVTSSSGASGVAVSAGCGFAVLEATPTVTPRACDPSLERFADRRRPEDLTRLEVVEGDELAWSDGSLGYFEGQA